ncbi:protease pro-enzyme activation domain-containing protein [Rhodanobacter sp. L36]|uniref:S53 family peptidase n=1 Tax=Rhodanobacter sp. L36 TaxID=1747221 RepID=UPI00131B34AF|nr:protease pro-enzyme activation domain-containing protein [Rhodanobacter sp. L36]
MKNGHFMLRASIAAALAATSAGSFAASTGANALAGINTAEAPRVSQTINNNAIATLPHSRPVQITAAVAGNNVDASTPMSHLQLMLRPSAVRTAQLQTLISQQHDPASARFHQWLTPAQYGQAFGLVDSDVEAVTAWLTSQGFKVNGVYPNKTQIDFSGTAGQVNLAFHTQEKLYTVHGETGIANATDISVPAALQPVIAGVIGLHNLQPKPQQTTPVETTWNAATHRFVPKDGTASTSHPQTVGSTGLYGLRGLVPDDVVKMYGLSTIRTNGVTGKGITIALIELGSPASGDWSNFVSQFNLTQYGGTYKEFQPQVGTMNNCTDQDSLFPTDSISAAEDSEWATAMAPGANIWVANCSALNSNFMPASTNIYQGFFIASTNLVNSDARPDIMSFSISYGEDETDSASKMGMDVMAAQADAEGISIFAGTGNGSSPEFYFQPITGAGLTSGSIATSPNVTAVGGTDLADELDGTTSKYFSSTPGANYGTALSYVPEIPWNDSCGNGVAAKAYGFSDVVSFCKFRLSLDPAGKYITSEGTNGGASVFDAKPAWQRLVHNTAQDQSRDIPDVALYGGSYGRDTGTVICTQSYPCAPGFNGSVAVNADTSLAAPMFAGIQALIDQGIAMRGLPADQGNAAPTLYALAQQEYGSASGTAPASLAACSADNGTNGTASCVFHNVTRGSNSTQCYHYDGEIDYVTGAPLATPNCYFYATTVINGFNTQEGLTSLDPTKPYSPQTKAYSAQAGWSFASGLGSVNATNLLIAWRGFVNAPPASKAK